jgi:hypothetical protein
MNTEGEISHNYTELDRLNEVQWQRVFYIAKERHRDEQVGGVRGTGGTSTTGELLTISEHMKTLVIIAANVVGEIR